MNHRAKYLLLTAAAAGALSGQSPRTVREVVDAALKAYPSVRVSQEEVNAAAAGIQLARTAFLPRVDTLAQVNRGTRNNVFGLLLPQSTIPSMSGPVIGSNNFGSVFGSAAGVLVSWEPFDFGLRDANVAVATALKAQSEATLKRTRFEVAAQAAEAYLTLAAAQVAVKAAEAGVQRSEVIARSVRALAAAELRPGADAARSDAEVAAARLQVIRAKQAVDLARVAVARLIGTGASGVAIDAAATLGQPPDQAPQAPDVAANPVAAEQTAVVEQTRARLMALERTYFPKFVVQGSAYARGTGAETNGTRLGWLNGLAPTTQDYALGLTVTFPVTDRPALRAKEAAQSAAVRAETARYDRIAADLRAGWEKAVVDLDAARQVVATLPTEVAAARAASQQATARYQAGLDTIDPVAEAERLLTQAEIDEALGKLNVWRGLLAVATAAGDLEPFLVQASQ